MTTTNECILGIGKRNSSRVLRPPGGASSFSIFGVPPHEEPKPTKGQGREQQTAETTLSSSAEAESSPCNASTTADLTSDTTNSLERSATAEGTETVDIDSKEEQNDSATHIEESDEKKQNNEENSEISASDTAARDEVVENTEVKVDSNTDSSEVQVENDVNANDRVAAKVNECTSPTRTKAGPKDCGFNPITGEAYVKTTTSTSQTTNIRVRQPPGGASTKLW